MSYPFVKRFLSVPQMYLGVTFGWGIPMAFVAQLEQVPRVAWLLLLANVLWVTVYDTIYAMVDRDDDLKIGVRSTAILFGDSDRHIIAVLQIMTLLSLYLVGTHDPHGPLVPRGPVGGRGVFRLSVVADPRSRSRGLLSRLSQQQLFRDGRVHRHGVGVSVCALSTALRDSQPARACLGSRGGGAMKPACILLIVCGAAAAGCGRDAADIAPVTTASMILPSLG